MENNPQPTDKQLQPLQVTPATGNVLSFARSVPDLKKIKEIPADALGDPLGKIMAFAAFQIGIKEPINKLVKEDIKEMILKRFKSLSLEEVNEAFKLDRFGEFGDPLPSYQLFNAEFVGRILTRYKTWLQKTRLDNNLPMEKGTPHQIPELSEEEKSRLIVNGVFTCFEDYKAEGRIDPGRLYVYEFLYDRGLLPEHNKAFRDRIKEKAQAQAIKETEAKRKSAGRDERASLKHKINDLKAGNYSLRAQCRTLILKEYFDQLIKNNQDIKDLI